MRFIWIICSLAFLGCERTPARSDAVFVVGTYQADIPWAREGTSNPVFIRYVFLDEKMAECQAIDKYGNVLSMTPCEYNIIGESIFFSPRSIDNRRDVGLFDVPMLSLVGSGRLRLNEGSKKIDLYLLSKDVNPQANK